MKIGIFECGHMPENLQDSFISYPNMVIQTFKCIDDNFEYKIYEATKNHFPEDINECDAYISTGSRYGVHDGHLWITQLGDFIHKCLEQNKKLIGICFGHQLTAKLMGGKVAKSERGAGIGIIENQLVKHETWMEPKQDKFKLIISHEDQIEKIPEGATLLASNAHCENFMVKYSENILGIQGHPEFNNDFSRGLMTARAELIPDNVLNAGYDSLSMTPDNQLITQWLVQFLKN